MQPVRPPRRAPNGVDIEALRRLAAGGRGGPAPMPGPPSRGRRSAGWGAGTAPARLDWQGGRPAADDHGLDDGDLDDGDVDDDDFGDGDPDDGDLDESGLTGGQRPGERTSGLREALLDRLPPEHAERAARWSLPGPAVMVLVLLAVAACAAIGVAALVRTPELPAPQTVPLAASTAPDDGAVGAAEQPGTVPAPTTGAGPAGSGAAAEAAPPGTVVVHVVGQVLEPGVVELDAGARVADAVQAAGGLTGEADTARVNLARTLVDGEQVVVPRPGEELPADTGPPPESGSDGAATGSRASAGGGDQPLDLNAATAADLEALPGIGPVLSERVVEWRDQHGRFSSVEELREVSGIGDAMMQRLRPLVRV